MVHDNGLNGKIKRKLVGPQLEMHADNQRLKVMEANWRQIFKEHIDTFGSWTVVNVWLLRSWPRQERLQFLLALCGAGIERFAAQDGRAQKTPLGLIAARPPAHTDITRTEQWLLLMVEAAAVYHKVRPEVAAEVIVDACKDTGAAHLRRDQIRRDIKELQRTIDSHGQVGATEMTVGACLADLPDNVNPELVIPPGFTVSAEGISRQRGSDTVPVSSSPFIITAMHREVDNGKVYVTVAWQQESRWVNRTVPRAAIADRKSIIGLAEWGAPVTSNNAGDLVQYLADFEAVNGQSLSRGVVSRQMGWHLQGEKPAFLFGTTALYPDGESSAADLVFRGPDGGEEQIAARYCAHGTLEDWAAAFAKLKGFPVVMLGLYTAFAALLLKLCGVPSFTFELAGETSVGKTAAMRMIASVFGCPAESDPRSIVNPFDASRVWRERAPIVACDFALFLDDTKSAKDPQQVADHVYLMSQGSARGRGSIQGMRATEVFRIICFLTGEEQATSLSRDGGACVRVLSNCGSPFGSKSPKIARLIGEVLGVLVDNYGHAGKTFVQYLLNHHDQWSKWKGRFSELSTEYQQKAAQNDYARRMAPIFAVICLTAELVHEALDLPWCITDPVEPLYAKLCLEAAKADRAAEAMLHVLNWAMANRAGFQGGSLEGGQVKPPQQGWYGVIRHMGSAVPPMDDVDKEHRQIAESKREEAAVRSGELPPWKLICFRPDVLKQTLETAGYREVEAILRSWHERKWLDCSPGDKRRMKKIRNGKESMWAYAINHAAYLAVMGD